MLSALIFLLLVLLAAIPHRLRQQWLGDSAQAWLARGLLIAGVVALIRRADGRFIEVTQYFPEILGLQLHNGFLQGAALTVFLSLSATMLCLPIGATLALAVRSRDPLVATAARSWISFFRGTPLLLHLFLLYFALPEAGIVLTATAAGIVALALCYSSYVADIFRAAVENIDKGQLEAARALGLSRNAIRIRIILPQATRTAIAPTINIFILLVKDSSLVSVLGIWEMTYLARLLGRRELAYLEMLLAVAVVYWLICAALAMLQRFVEDRMQRPY